MSHIKKIEINNFRCFEKFEIGDFKTINVLVGKSNSGKSCLLESLFIAIDANPLMPAGLNNLRGLGYSSEQLKYLFHNFDLNTAPILKINFSDQRNTELKLSPNYNIATINEKPITRLSSSVSKKVIGINLELKLSSEKIYKASYMLDDEGNQKNILSDYQSNITAAFIPPIFLGGFALTCYSELIKKRKEAVILEILQKIEPKIQGIQALPEGIFFIYDKMNELVPIQILGGGIQQAFNIITQIANEDFNVIFIDEIETGLHYSAHSELWKGIFALCKTLNTQLFITTHNIETLSSLKEVLELDEYQSMQNEMAIFNLVNTKKYGLKAYQYSFEGIKEAIELNQEMRY
ncbi:MAG: AAA family ATPase [Methylococcales bacterium]|nr:AAA family ATPase [Methylococcales bacterium]